LRYYSNCNIIADGDQANGGVLVESGQAAEGLDTAGNGQKTGGVATVLVLAGERTPAIDEARSVEAQTAP
jgi:hypothetical protein